MLLQWVNRHPLKRVKIVRLQRYFAFTISGIWLHESGVLGASPDGIVRAPPRSVPKVHWNDPDGPRHEPQLLEVKCPYSARDMTVADAVHKVKGFFLGTNFYSDMQKRTTSVNQFQINLIAFKPQKHYDGTFSCFSAT